MFLISLVTGVVFGLAPAIASTKPNLTDALKSTTSRPRLSRPHLRNLLVIGQVAVSLVLLIGAGLLVRGLQKAQSTDLGFDQKNLAVMSMDLTAQGFDESRTTTLYAQLSERFKALPAIKSVSLAEVAPFSGARETIIDIADGNAPSLSVGANAVSTEYFQTLGIPLRRGRQFTEEDARSGESPAVISEAMANRFWPGVDPVGQRFRDGDRTSHQIIGVVADISSRQVGQLDGPLFYTPTPPAKLNGLSFVMRTNGNMGTSVSAIREAGRSLDKDIFVSVEPLEQNLKRMLEPVRMGAWFSGTVSLLALLIAATGIYGMLSYHVVERTREIGIRMALGAQRRNVLLLIVTDGMKLAVIGIVIGLAGAIAMSKVMTTMLLGIAPADAVTFATVSATALFVALLACYVPARRATKVNPLIALRND